MGRTPSYYRTEGNSQNQSLYPRCLMSTDRQIEANRLNAQHSTGPSTPEGRAAVRLNGLKYGLYPETPILPRADPPQFQALLHPPPPHPPPPPPPPPPS